MVQEKEEGLIVVVVVVQPQDALAGEEGNKYD